MMIFFRRSQEGESTDPLYIGKLPLNRYFTTDKLCIS